MVDIRALYASGYSPQKLRQLFVPDAGPAARKPKIKDLLELTTSRVREGVNRQLKFARHWWIIDQACDVSSRSLGTTALRGLQSKNPDPKTVIKTLQEWGMSAYLNPILDADGQPKTDRGGNPLYKIDESPIVDVVAPICQQYLFARWATLVTQRDSSPWLKYSPQVYSRKSHLKASIFTSRADRMVHEMGYRADFNQESLCALKYGYQFSFAREPYYWEKQKQMTKSGMVEVVVREGIRTALPHPSRTIFDLGHRMSTLNTNTGMEYAGYWDVFRWGNVLSNPDFWLTDEQRQGRFGYGVGLGMEVAAWSSYAQLYPTTMNFPAQLYTNNSRSDIDRVAESNNIVYSSRDQGVVISPIFQKLNPKEWGLFDYDGDVWFCFTMANGDTPLLVEPYGYVPARVMQMQGDQSHWRPTSMVTDLVPFQDSIGNLLTQYLMTVRRNLMNLIYYNKDSVSKAEIDHLMGQATGLWTGPNLVPVSFKAAQLDSTTAQISDQFKTVSFPPGDTVLLISAINTMLGIVERVVGFTAQEVGTTGAHVQTAEEIRVTASFSNNRIALTDSFFDQSIAAQKRQIYDAFMNYGDDLVMADITDASELDKKELDEMGVLIETGDGRKMGVMADKASLSLSGFASDREGSRRTNDAKVATAFMQFAQTVLSVPQISEAIGVEGMVEAFNTVAQIAGLGPDARFKLPTNGQPAVPQMMEQVQKLVMDILGQQMDEIGAGLRKEVIEPQEQMSQQIQQLAAKSTELEQALTTVLGQIQQAQQPQQAQLF